MLNQASTKQRRARAAALVSSLALLALTACDGPGARTDPEAVAVAAVATVEATLIVWGEEHVTTTSVPGCDAGAGAFGAAVSLAPGTLLVGAPEACDGGRAAGALVVFDRFGEQWTESAVVRRPGPEDDAGFGAAVAFAAPTLAVGAPGAAAGEGRVDVLQRIGWYFYALGSFAPPPGAPPSDGPSGFGTVLAADARTVFAGAPSSSPGASEAGAVYVYRESDGAWASSHILRQTPAVAGAHFGRLVAVDGRDAAIASDHEITLFERDSDAAELLPTATLPIGDARALHLGGGVLAVLRASPVVELYARDDDGAFALTATLEVPGADPRALSLTRGQLVVSSSVGVASFVQAPGATSLADGWSADGTVSGSAVGAPAVSAGAGFVVVGDGAGGVVSYRRVASEGEPCSDGLACESGFCVDGVCCESACGAGEVDCLACSMAAGSSQDGRCEVAAAGAVCRVSVGACDRAEQCNGVSDRCPADGMQPAGYECRASAGGCDVAETCSGVSAFCPSDTLLPVGTLCRASAGACDVGEVCDGVRGACPADRVKPAGTTCRERAGACDVAEVCDGEGATCPNDRFHPFGTVCRSPAGACDAAERCSGLHASCPSDAFLPDGSECVDGDVCTDGDQCVTGRCIAGPRICEDPSELLELDAGVPGGDAGPGDGGKVDVVTDAGSGPADPGCGCSQQGAAAPTHPRTALALLVVLASSLVRRRRS